ncbi:hypothetical protein BT96DRAFT_1008381 [Gymnopus androsaceus JB14]|uniref:Uncharacterized protein n=1 Tax=Gymnopus androsaceus JB14 TaxID=1447944 RepID=A0A6A4GFK3_9AGAR|nr:hypothetical protein BT96DRAFT_1008381 [Gymnopus androsaceus JB14]
MSVGFYAFTFIPAATDRPDRPLLDGPVAFLIHRLVLPQCVFLCGERYQGKGSVYLVSFYAFTFIPAATDRPARPLSDGPVAFLIHRLVLPQYAFLCGERYQAKESNYVNGLLAFSMHRLVLALFHFLDGTAPDRSNDPLSDDGEGFRRSELMSYICVFNSPTHSGDRAIQMLFFNDKDMSIPDGFNSTATLLGIYSDTLPCLGLSPSGTVTVASMGNIGNIQDFTFAHMAQCKPPYGIVRDAFGNANVWSPDLLPSISRVDSSVLERAILVGSTDLYTNWCQV